MISKEYLRRTIRKKGDSFKICEQILQMSEYEKADGIHIFLSKSDEPDTRTIIKNAWQNGKKVFVPIVQNDNLGSVEFGPNDNLILGKFGILVPSQKEILKKVQVDIIFVPLVAFDRNKNRLGRGGGFYDRFLMSHSGLKVGLAFASQAINQIPIEDHDIPLDKIITD